MMVKLLSFLSVLALVSSLVMTVLWQSTRLELIALQSKHTKLQSDHQLLTESKSKLEASHKVDSDLIYSLNAEILSLSKKEETVVTGISLYRPKCTPRATSEKQANETQYVDIDAPFDPELLRLYKGSDNL